jgi:hypothetical protein
VQIGEEEEVIEVVPAERPALPERPITAPTAPAEEPVGAAS